MIITTCAKNCLNSHSQVWILYTVMYTAWCLLWHCTCSLHVEVFLPYTKDNWCYYHSHIIIIEHPHPATTNALWMLNFISMFLKLQNSQCSQCSTVPILPHSDSSSTSGWRRSDLVWEPLTGNWSSLNWMDWFQTKQCCNGESEYKQDYQ